MNNGHQLLMLTQPRWEHFYDDSFVTVRSGILTVLRRGSSPHCFLHWRVWGLEEACHKPKFPALLGVAEKQNLNTDQLSIFKNSLCFAGFPECPSPVCCPLAFIVSHDEGTGCLWEAAGSSRLGRMGWLVVGHWVGGSCAEERTQFLVAPFPLSGNYTACSAVMEGFLGTGQSAQAGKWVAYGLQSNTQWACDCTSAHSEITVYYCRMQRIITVGGDGP